jgi:hypothetical protein
VFYENVNGKDESVFTDLITEDGGLYIYLNYLEQESLLPFSNFETFLGVNTIAAKRDKEFQIVSSMYNVYGMEGEIIEPVSVNIHPVASTITKFYKYSVFFPEKIKMKIEVKFFYDGKYYEYSKETVLTKKRNRTWWSVAKGI